jgi:hypothetical protein
VAQPMSCLEPWQELGAAMKHTIHDMMQPRGTSAATPGLDCEEAANAVMAGAGSVSSHTRVANCSKSC